MARHNGPDVVKSASWPETNVDLPSRQPSTDLPREDFKRIAQLKRMLSTGLLRWLMTASLAASIYGILWGYSMNEALPSRKKQELDTLIIGMSIALGLNIASSFKADVRRLRWWLLSLHWYTPREADLIIQSEKLGCLLLLGWTSRRWTAKIFALTFLVLNLASQVVLALLGLAYNISSADKYTLTEPGTVLIPDMSDFGLVRETTEEGYDGSPEALATSRYLAHKYSINQYGLKVSDTDLLPRPGKIFNSNDPLLYFSSENLTYTFQFYESDPVETNYGSKVATNRSVSVRAGCDSWPVIQGGNGLSENITVRFENGSTQIWQLPAVKGSFQTTFFHDPMSEAGDNWAIVHAFSASEIDPWVYSCNVTIDPVVNAVIKEHLLGTELMRSAAPAVALQGYDASSTNDTNDPKRYQFQSYPAETYLGLSFRNDTQVIAQKVAYTAISSIVVQAETNTGMQRPGMVPVAGISLEVKPWGLVYLILGLTVGVQLFVTIVSVLVANRVQVRCHNHLSMAALIQSIPPRADHSTGATGQEQTSVVIDTKARLRYAPERDGTYHIQSKQL